MAEFEIIDELLKPLATHPGALSLSDDAALLSPKAGRELVLTKDLMVEGVHYLHTAPPAHVAQKLLRVNLSDLAAMGATPVGYLLGLQLPKTHTGDWLKGFVAGLQEDQKTYGISLLGGDTVGTSGPAALSLTALGEIPTGTALRRSGAKAGEAVYVSGTIGDGVLGLKAARKQLGDLSREDRDYLIDRLELPTPRLDLGQVLRGRASAAIDVSDGLVADAGHVAEASGVHIEIDLEAVPLSLAAQKAVSADLASMVSLITGGDDFELLFTGEGLDDLRDITPIGRVLAGEPGVTVLSGGEPVRIKKAGFTHL